MKKTLMIIMILLLAITLIACASPDPVEDDVDPEELPQPPEEEEPIEEPDVNEEVPDPNGEDPENPVGEVPAEEDPDPIEEVDSAVVSLYFVNDQYMETGDESIEAIVVEERDIDINGSIEEAIVQALMDGAEGSNASTLIPETANLLGVEVIDGTAHVDFAREGMNGSSSQESFTIEQIVSSLGELENVDRVQFLIDGEIGDSLMGHIIIDEPFEVEN